MDSKLLEKLKLKEDTYYFDLHVSASIGCEESVRDIIENAENKEIVNKHNLVGWTPLMYAACSANFKILLFLLEEGAYPDLQNDTGQTALIIASKCGSTDAVNLLIDFRANVNVRDIKGWSAIFYASAFGHRSVVQLLIEKGAILDICDKEDGFNPLMLSSAAGHEMIVKDLLLQGLSPSLESKSGDTARSLAVKYGHHKVKNLIDAYSKKSYSIVNAKIYQSDLLTFLKELQLSKYYQIFENQGVDLNTFMMLTDEDFKEMGINLFGPRKKMCLAISKYHSQHPNSNCDDKELLNKLSVENKQLSQQIEKIKMELLHEVELRKIAEKNLSDGVMTLKNFTDNMQQTMRYTLVLKEKLRQNNANLKKLFYSTTDISREKFKRDIIFPVLDGNEKLLEEIHSQIFLAIQQTDFRQ